MLEQKNTEIKLHVQRIYTKDISFEAPNTPEIFKIDWNPKIHINLNNTHTKISDNIYEVTLCITVTALLSATPAFLCQVKQSGIFNILGLNNTQTEYCLKVCCPNILFPYVRECISNQVSRGTFPALILEPINFDFLFLKSLKNKSKNLPNN